ncbi:MAG: beta-phosphoglucomutase [Chloroflexi bacterium 44-23]|nr:MAG: beta-phosphoglucomutase [Chloroflexi bacterium 44-23]
MIRAFLFDLDGVLTDTSEFHFLAWKRLGEDLQIPFNREQNEALRGVSRRESLALLLQGKTVTEEEAQQLMERKNRYYVDYIKKLTPANVLPGSREILIELASMGLKRMIVSASKNAALVIKLLQIGDLIDGVVDGSSQARSKPAPDLFLLAAKALDLDPKFCLVLEDAAAGIEAAHAAGMLAVGLGPVERVGAAELVIPSLEGQSAISILKRLDKKKSTYTWA